MGWGLDFLAAVSYVLLTNNLSYCHALYEGWGQTIKFNVDSLPPTLLNAIVYTYWWSIFYVFV